MHCAPRDSILTIDNSRDGRTTTHHNPTNRPTESIDRLARPATPVTDAVADDPDQAQARPPMLLRPRNDAELAALRQEALAYAAANGLLMAAPLMAEQQQTLYGQAPFALLPDPFPAREYMKARDLAPLFNTLVRFGWLGWC